MDLYVATQAGMNDAPLDDLDMAHPAMDTAWNRARGENNALGNSCIRVICAVSPGATPRR